MVASAVLSKVVEIADHSYIFDSVANDLLDIQVVEDVYC